MKINVGFAITGSFCTHKTILDVISSFDKDRYNIIPIVTKEVAKTDTRFGKASEFLSKLEKYTGNKVLTSIVEVEPLGPKNLIDCLVVAPCTGNTIAKLANAITDDAVTMTAKSLSRNSKPIIVGISTNDGLGLNLKNIAGLMQVRNYYFVPFGQDDYINKPKSLICDWDKLDDTITSAISGIQLQPLLIGGK